jgi:hypothetical protein
MQKLIFGIILVPLVGLIVLSMVASKQESKKHTDGH